MRIIYIDMDSFRPDHSTPYGYQRNITPNIQTIADKGLRMDQFHSADTPCVPSRAGFTTQRFGITTGAMGHQNNDADLRLTESRSQHADAPFLGFHLANEAGYHTVGMSCFPERHQAWWFHSNFMEFIRPSLSLGYDEDSKDVSDSAIDWLERNGQKENWFLALSYWDTHMDYQISTEWAEKAAASGPAPDWPDQAAIDKHQHIYGANTAADLRGVYGEETPVPDITPDQIATRADFEKLINGYDGAVAYTDFHIGRVLDKLKELGLEEDTAIVLTADHGEAFGENGVYAEHAMAHPATTRVPMIIYWPGLTDKLPPEARSHQGLCYQLDFGPTLCDLLDIPIPKGWHGRSFAPLLRGESMEGRPYLVLSQGVHTFQRAVRMGDLLYIRTLHPGTYRINAEELYDLAVDPHLTTDLMPTESERAVPLKAALADWWHQYAGQPWSEPDPLQAVLHRGPVLYSDPERYLARMESMGRTEQAADYRQRLGKFLVDKHVVPAHELPKKTFE